MKIFKENLKKIGLVAFFVLIVGGIAWTYKSSQVSSQLVTNKKHEKTLSPAQGVIGDSKNSPTLNSENSTTSDASFSGADPKKVIILTYHSVEPATPGKHETKMQAAYHIFPEIFEQQMAYLEKNGYHPVTFDTLVKALNGSVSLPEKAVVLTFDDGWKNQYVHAAPILEKYNFTGTFFIITTYIGKKAYVTWDEIKDLQARGFEIASHTQTHPHLTKLTPEQLLLELAESKKTLEEKLSIPVSTLAYPYYNHDEVVRGAVKDAGYLGARGGWAKGDNSVETIYSLKSQEVLNKPNPFSQ